MEVQDGLAGETCHVASASQDEEEGHHHHLWNHARTEELADPVLHSFVSELVWLSVWMMIISLTHESGSLLTCQSNDQTYLRLSL